LIDAYHRQRRIEKPFRISEQHVAAFGGHQVIEARTGSSIKRFAQAARRCRSIGVSPARRPIPLGHVPAALRNAVALIT
jgi:hypothetical protein